MNEIVNFSDVEKRIISLRNQQVILDSDVAELYGVETKEINQAVRNNPRKFPKGYVWEVDSKELINLRSKILTTNLSAKSRSNPKAFTEKGLYMLATILKGDAATNTTIAIVEAFTRMRQLARTIGETAQANDKEQQNALLQKCGQIVNDMLSRDLGITSSETSFELNLALVKFKHSITQSKDVEELKRLIFVPAF